MEKMNEMEDEINLVDIIKVLVKRKVLIIGGTLLCLAVAVAGSLLLPKVYKVSFLADIGMIQMEADMKPVESLENVKSKLEAVYSYPAMEALGMPEGVFPDIMVENPKNTMLIEGSLKTSKPAEGVKILKYVQNLLLKDHERLLNQYRVGIQNSIKKIDLDILAVADNKLMIDKKIIILKTNIEETKKQIREAKQRIDDLRKEKKRINLKAKPDNTLSLLLFTNEIRENQRYYNQLQNKLDSDLAGQQVQYEGDLQNNGREKERLEMDKLKLEAQFKALRETKVVKPPSYSERPVSPNKRMIVALAGVIGLMGSIFLAFFMEFIEKYRKEQAEEEQEIAS